MADDLNQGAQSQGQPAPSPTVPTPPSSPPVPQDYEELRKFREEYEPFLQAVAPFYEDIAPIIQDEETREFYRRSRKALEESKKAAEPQVPPEFQPVVDRFEKTLTPLVEYVNQDRAAKEARQRAEQEAAQRENLAYAQRLVADHPALAEDEYAGIDMLASYAAKRNISLEEAWKRKSSTLGVAPRPAAPPRSLRGDAGAPGVPGESTAPPIKSHKDLKNRLVANLRAGGMKG